MNFITNTYKERYLFDKNSITLNDVEQRIKTKLESLKSYTLVENENEQTTMFPNKESGPSLEEQQDALVVIWAKWTSSCWGFIDDMVFMIGENEEDYYVDVISTSRSGKYDFGKNKQHVHEIMDE